METQTPLQVACVKDRQEGPAPGSCRDSSAAANGNGLALRLFLRYGGEALRRGRQLVILLVGVSVLLIGLAGVVLPAVPAVVLMPAGLAILSVEFVWARRLLERLRRHLKRARERCLGNGSADQPRA